jgi:hypothetical protein
MNPMGISELSVYEFLKEKIKLSDTDARNYTKELSSAEEKLRFEIKDRIATEIKIGDFATKRDIKDLEIKLERGFKEVIIWVIASMVAVVGLAVALIKLF